MRKILLGLLFITMGSSFTLLAQTCTTNSHNNIFGRCSGFVDQKPAVSGNQATYSGNYTISIRNNESMTINGYAIINGTLTVDFGGNNGYLSIPAGDTLRVTNLTFTNVNPAQEKVLDVDGVLIVTGTLNFSDDTIEIDGGGSISAGTITGAGNTGCSGTNDCPNPFKAGSCSPAGGLCSEGVLPVQLTEFNAQVISEGGVELSWATLLEKNFHYFSLQRSGNGKDFNEIAQILGNGNSSARRDYKYLDDAPLSGKSYYRLTSVDFDNTRETFNVVSVTYHGKKSVRIFPNPTADSNINLELSYTPTSPVKITVTDLAGIIKGQFMVEAQLASFNTKLDPGTYLVMVSSEDLNKVIRVVVH